MITYHFHADLTKILVKVKGIFEIQGQVTPMSIFQPGQNANSSEIFIAPVVKDQKYFHKIDFPKTPIHFHVYKKLCIVWSLDLITIIL